MDDDSTKTDKDAAPALTRGLRILDLVAQSPDGLSMTEVSRTLGLAKSSVYGLCQSLLNGGMLEKSQSGRFRLGLRIIDLANSRTESSNAASEFYRQWETYEHFAEEGAVLAIRDRSDVVYVACRNSRSSLGITFRIGMRLPARFTATGKAMLSVLSDDEVIAIHQGIDWLPLTPNSVADLDALLAQLATIRARGYSVDDGETRSHMFSVGAPLRNLTPGSNPMAVAISQFRAELTEEKRQAAVEATVRLSDDLSRLGSFH